MRAVIPDAYDLIGDVHGQAERLRALLGELGYREQDGAYRHPQRQAIFLGDFIDRGPHQRHTVAIARAMVQAGSARVVLGNHELNAIGWQTQDPGSPGDSLRPHTDKNRNQHEGFLREVEDQPEVHADIVDWFRTLPLFLELPGLRVIHACWDPMQLEAVSPYLDENDCLTEAGLIAANRQGTSAYTAVETLIKGPEMPLPKGHEVADAADHPRTHVRVRWWDGEANDLASAALLGPAQRALIPREPLPEQMQLGYSGEKPLFIGHYQLGDEIAPLTTKVACLDYSGRGDGGNRVLCAYRWQGETVLNVDNFRYVSR